MSLIVVVVAIFLCATLPCTSFSLDSPPPPLQQPAPVIVQRYKTPIESTLTRRNVGETYYSSSCLLSAVTERPEVQTQSQQMNDAMVIKTMRGTQWRIVEDRLTDGPSSSYFFGKKSPRYCKSLATFGGFNGIDNKGTVSVEYFCGGNSGADTVTATRSTTTKGRWITKPSRLSRGSVQLSARWKVKVPNDGDDGGTIIYKGFIDADKIIGRKGKSVSAEMVGVILTGKEVNKEKVIGKFTADFVRQLSEEEEREAANSAANVNNGPITLSPK